MKGGKLVGYVDSYPSEIQLFGMLIKRWLRTSLVVGPWRSLEKLLPLTLPIPDAEIFSDDPAEFFLQSAALSSNYKEYLKTWLFQPHSEGSRFKSSWHSKAQIDENNFGDFKNKARSILAEHYFSARARNLGIDIYPVKRRFARTRKRTRG